MSTSATLEKALSSHEVIVLPGWRNSGPTHWQTRWQERFPAFRRVEQADWVQPRRADWIAALELRVQAASKPVILIAHSLGCATVAHWAAEHDSSKIAGALLVAPADVERVTVASCLRGFAPLPRQHLPFHTVLVASDNDPCCIAWRAAELADTWGAEFHLLAGLGHINADSNLGEWTPGLEYLARAFPHKALTRAA